MHDAPDGDGDGLAEAVLLHVVIGERVGVQEVVRVREGLAVTGARWRGKWVLMKAKWCSKVAQGMPKPTIPPSFSTAKSNNTQHSMMRAKHIENH